MKDTNNLNQPEFEIELTVVMPCLNEADTLAICLQKARAALEQSSIVGEIIVADNGSSDGSIEIARENGARLVHVPQKGYGSALMGGIEAARGKYVLMGDADDSYDFHEIPKFVERLRQGFDLVQGCRLPSGGGRVMPGAMPFLHRWWGNPMFSFLARLWFKTPAHDVHCGMRGFTKSFYNNLGQRCTGMEFATEMLIKASFSNAKIAEVPITLYKDGRMGRAPHLKTFRDGWRHLRLYLMYSPRWLFLFPGVFLIALGVIGYILALPQLTIEGFGRNGRITFDVHTLLFASLFVICGYQAILFGIFSKTFAISEKLLPEDPKMTKFYEWANLERGLILSATAVLAGFFLLAASVYQWWLVGFSELDYTVTMRFVIPGATLTALGVQTMFSSFFISLLGMKRK